MNLEPEQIYYDIQITNTQSVKTVEPTLYYSETRTTPILFCPENYDMSIIRFYLNTNTLPLFICNVNSGFSSDINQSIYGYYFSYNGYINTAKSPYYIIWSPQNKNAPIPSNFNSYGIQDNTYNYYSCYSYSYFVNLINSQLQANFTDYLNDLVANTSYVIPTPTPLPPRISYNPSTSLFSITFDSSFIGDDTTVTETPFYFYMNNSLFSLFNSFNANYLGTKTDLNWCFNVSKNDVITSVSSLGSSVILTQSYSTLNNWSPISSIVFTSNTLPVVSNLLAKPALFVEGALTNTGGNNSNFSNIITDLEAESFNGYLLYNPQAEYRLISLIGTSPLSTVDISVFYKNVYGELIPFQLGSGGTCTLKILFRKKKLISYKNL